MDPFVVPKTRSGSSFVEALSNKVQLEKVIGKNASLGKSITALVNFKVDPTISVLAQEVVFFDKLIRDIRDLDVNIFRIRHRCVQIEVLEINDAEPSSLERTLLSRSLTSSSKAVLVPTLPG
jgi:hypothetical protein